MNRRTSENIIKNAKEGGVHSYFLGGIIYDYLSAKEIKSKSKIENCINDYRTVRDLAIRQGEDVSKLPRRLKRL